MQAQSPASAPGSAIPPAAEAVRRHLEGGAPWDACDAFREGIAAHPEDAELLYWGALAHARAGAVHHARTLLDQAQARPESAARLADILSLRGRLWKDALHRWLERGGARRDQAENGGDLRAFAERAREAYLAAYGIAQDPYPGVNAATMSMLLGECERAQALAREVLARLASQTAPHDCWHHATAGEAQLLLGEFEWSFRSYAQAQALAPDAAGAVAAMRRQAKLLQPAIPEAAEALKILRTRDVLAFAGHMIDAADRPSPRFPRALEPAVEAAIREIVRSLHHPIVYASAACGADLIFLEAALDAGAEVNVVLPFDRDDFLRTSVAIGGDGWAERFERALARASRVILATEEAYLGDDVLFEHASSMLEGLAVLRAAQLETAPTMLCVIDADAPRRVGGTRASFERWNRTVGQPRVIDLGALRASMPAVPAQPRVSTGSGAAPAPRNTGASAPPAERLPRSLKSILFADFAGYSRLHDAYAPLFQHRFLEVGARQIESSAVKPLEAKTWGDALYVVFESPCVAAEFALRFLAGMMGIDWTEAGLPAGSQIRIALHAGPVFRDHDPVMGRESFFGSNVTRAARIEPVTPPGMVYTSEGFAAALACEGRCDYALEYIGRLPLAKGYGESRIYRLDWR